MYVGTDFLSALVNDDDWLHDPAVRVLDERDDIHTSILAYAEVLVLFYDRGQADHEIDAPRAVSNLLELVPIEPAEHEDAVLAAAAFLDEYHLTPFDALHAGLVATHEDTVLSTDQDYDALGLERVPLAPDTDE